MFSFFCFCFSEIILLTTQNVDIDSSLILTPKTPIKAVTERARISIDIQSMLPKGFNFFDNSSDSIFPKGCVVAQISNNQNNKYLFTSSNRLSPSSDGSVSLMLSNGHIPVDIKFDKVEIHTTCPLKNVKIYWDDYGGI